MHDLRGCGCGIWESMHDLCIYKYTSRYLFSDWLSPCTSGTFHGRVCLQLNQYIGRFGLGGNGTPSWVNFYRPQTKFVKVMFSQVSVCPQGGVCPIACWDISPRPEADTHLAIHPPGQTPPGQTPHERHPQDKMQTPPCAVHAGIQSTSGRYTSPLECILVFFICVHICVKFDPKKWRNNFWPTLWVIASSLSQI